MAFRNSTEEKRWLVINKYLEYRQKDPNVKISKIHNFFKFNRRKDITYNFVLRAIQRYKNTGGASDTPRNVKKRKIDDDVMKSVIKQATNKKKPKYQRSTRKISKIKHGSRGKKRKISRSSVQNILKNSGKRYKRPKRVPLVTPHHKRMKKLWAEKHMDDSVDEWNHTLVIDETHYETFHKTNRQNSGEWVSDGEEAEPEQTVKHPGRVSASTGVCGFGASSVDLYTDKFNQDKFLDVHLKKKYVPAMKKYDCRRLVMDNDSSHHAKKCNKWMIENDVIFSSKPPPPCHSQRCKCKPPQGFWFPAYAPEVSPAELYNNYIQQELDNFAQRQGYPKSIKNLKSRIHQIVRKTPKSYFKNLMASMPSRIRKMYKANGGK